MEEDTETRVVRVHIIYLLPILNFIGKKGQIHINNIRNISKLIYRELWRS